MISSQSIEPHNARIHWVGFIAKSSVDQLLPAPLTGWSTIYYIDVPYGQDGNNYALILVYSAFDAKELMTALQSSLKSGNKPIIILFNDETFSQINDFLRKNFKYELSYEKTQRKWMVSLDLSDSVLKNLIISFANTTKFSGEDITSLRQFSLVQVVRKDATMDNTELERNALGAWAEPIKKRALFFTMLASKGINAQELGEQVTTRYQIAGTIDELVGLEVLSQDGEGNLTLTDGASRILTPLFADEFRNTPERIANRISRSIQATVSDSSFFENLKSQIEKLIEETGTSKSIPPRKDLKNYFVFKDARLVIIEPSDGYRNDPNFPSQARDVAETQFKEGARYICLIVAPKFGTELVNYTADWLKRRVALVDIVGLLQLESSAKEYRQLLEGDRKQKLLDIFVNNNAGALWDVNKGLRLLRP